MGNTNWKTSIQFESTFVIRFYLNLAFGFPEKFIIEKYGII